MVCDWNLVCLLRADFLPIRKTASFEDDTRSRTVDPKIFERVNVLSFLGFVTNYIEDTLSSFRKLFFDVSCEFYGLGLTGANSFVTRVGCERDVVDLSGGPDEDGVVGWGEREGRIGAHGC